MSAEPLDALLEKLSAGDPAAAEQVLADYGPYLRLVVRRRLSGRLRAKFDSLDVVQSVWAQVLRRLRGAGWHFLDRAQFLAFLVTVTRRRLTSRFRHHQAALRREQPVAPDLDGLPAPGPTQPAEAARAEELWEQMLALCPPAHHELLRLKRQGLTLAEVAVRTGLHEGSVRRVLRRLARQLALEQGPAPQLEEAPA